MRVIHRFPLALVDVQQVSVPHTVEVLHIGLKDGMPNLWAEVDTDVTSLPRTVYMVGTGHEVPRDAVYLGTVVMDYLVWHFYGATTK